MLRGLARRLDRLDTLPARRILDTACQITESGCPRTPQSHRAASCWGQLQPHPIYPQKDSLHIALLWFERCREVTLPTYSSNNPDCASLPSSQQEGPGISTAL